MLLWDYLVWLRIDSLILILVTHETLELDKILLRAFVENKLRFNSVRLYPLMVDLHLSDYIVCLHFHSFVVTLIRELVFNVSWLLRRTYWVLFGLIFGTSRREP